MSAAVVEPRAETGAAEVSHATVVVVVDPEPDDASIDEPVAVATAPAAVSPVAKPVEESAWFQENVLAGGQLQIADDGYLVATRDIEANASLVYRVEPCESAPIAKAVLWGPLVFRRAAHRALCLGSEHRRASFHKVVEIVTSRWEREPLTEVEDYVLPSSTIGAEAPSSDKLTVNPLDTGERVVHHTHSTPAAEDKATTVVVEPIAVLAGQACEPNTLVVVDTVVSAVDDDVMDYVVQVTSLSAIRKGERITVNHAPREHLRTSHGVICGCMLHQVCMPLNRAIEVWHRVQWRADKAASDTTYAASAYFMRMQEKLVAGSVDRLVGVGKYDAWPDFPTPEHCEQMHPSHLTMEQLFVLLDAEGKGSSKRERRDALVKWGVLTLLPPIASDFIYNADGRQSAHGVVKQTKKGNFVRDIPEPAVGEIESKAGEESVSAPELPSEMKHIPPEPHRAPHLAITQEHQDTHDAMAGQIAANQRHTGGKGSMSVYEVVRQATERFARVGTNFTALVSAVDDKFKRFDPVMSLSCGHIAGDASETEGKIEMGEEGKVKPKAKSKRRKGEHGCEPGAQVSKTHVHTLFEGLAGNTARIPVVGDQSTRMAICVIDATRAVVESAVDKEEAVKGPKEDPEARAKRMKAETRKGIIKQTPYWCDALGHVLHDTGGFRGDRPLDRTPYVGVTPMLYLKLCIQGMQPYNPTDAKRLFSLGPDALVPPGVLCIALPKKVNAALRDMGVPFEQRTMHVVYDGNATTKAANRIVATAAKAKTSAGKVDMRYFGLGFTRVATRTASEWAATYIMPSLAAFSEEAVALCKIVPAVEDMRVMDPMSVDHD